MRLPKKFIHLLFITFTIYNLISYNTKSAYGITKIEGNDPCKEYKIRLSSLEPEENINIYPSDIPLPTNTKPISEVIKKGKDLPLQFAYNDPNWKRPIYKDYWHTGPNGGRWSYVPERIDYALHRIFTYIPTASISYDAEGNLGIVDESNKFNIDISNIHQIILVVMNSNVKKIIHLGNQVLVMVEPKRTGLQVLTIPENIITPNKKNEATIFQMITPDEYEIDYALTYI